LLARNDVGLPARIYEPEGGNPAIGQGNGAII